MTSTLVSPCPLVSVIIPTHNHANFLGEAIDSIQHQTYQDFEIIVVDDGSTDETVNVMKKISDPRIRFVRQRNRGLGAARNAGIQLAQGSVIALLDADDAWMPRFLERAVARLVSNPSIGAVYAGFQYMDAAGNPLPGKVCRVVQPEKFHEALLEGCWLTPSAVVKRAECYWSAGLFEEDRRFGGVADYDIWIRLSKEYIFEGIPEVLVWYRRNGDNMSDDTSFMIGGMKLVLERHLGSIDAPIETWSEIKLKAISQLHSSLCQEYLSQGKFPESSRSIRWLVRNNRAFAISLELWYSLACVHQPVGRRGEFETWNPSKAEADLTSLVQALKSGGAGDRHLHDISAKAHLALGLMNYGKGNMAAARTNLWKAANYFPMIALTHEWILTLPKTYLSKRIRKHLRDLSRSYATPSRI